MKEGIKIGQDLVLYWYYTIMMLFPPKKIDNQDIKEGIDILKTYYINKYNVQMRDWNKLKKGQVFAVVRLLLKVPQKHYHVEFKNALEKSIEINKKNNEVPELGDYLSSDSTVSEIANRYEDLILGSDENAGVWTTIELQEYDTLIRLMIPDDPFSIFIEFIEVLIKNGLFQTRKSDRGPYLTIKDRGIEEQSYVPDRSGDKLFISGIFSDVNGPNWKNVSIGLVSDSSLRIKINGLKAKRYSYAQLGLSDRRKSDMPNRIWAFIKVLAKLQGRIPYKDLILSPKSKSGLNARNHVEKSVSELRKFLKQLTGIDDNPFYPFSKKIGYHAKFKIQDCRSEQYLDYLSEEDNTNWEDISSE